MRNDGSELDPSEIERAFRILVEAKKIEKNRELMKKVVEFADQQKAAINSIADLKDAYNRLVEQENKPMPKKVGVQKPKPGEDELDTPEPEKALEARVKKGE